MKKEKGSMDLRFTDYLGVSLMCFTESFTAGLMTSWFMQYLTDYAGLGVFGATLGSVMLLVMRIFDAVNDPFEGWIMDRAKVGKLGKYKPFVILSIILEAIGLSALFFIPGGIVNSPVLVILWVLVAYLIYDVGASFYAPNLIYRTLTLDSNKRGKLMIAPRMVTMVIGMICGSIITIVNGVNGSIGNLHTAFGVTVMAGAIITSVISLLGISMVKEKHHPKEDEAGDAVKLTDVFKLFKENEALRIRFLATVFSGFIWTFLFATTTYYVKWAYCADLTTGVIDTAKFGTLSLIASMLMLFPLILGTAIAMPLMKIFKTPVRTQRFVIAIQIVPCLLLFVFQMLGILQNSYMLFFILTAIAATGIGAGFIPGEAINIECMDYEIYKNGKDRSALVNSTTKFLDKAQSAISSGLIGVVLIAVGYVVDSATGNYLGDLANMPSMLTWFIVIMGLIPSILGVLSLVIYKNYPITPEIAAEMKTTLDEYHQNNKAD